MKKFLTGGFLLFVITIVGFSQKTETINNSNYKHYLDTIYSSTDLTWKNQYYFKFGESEYILSYDNDINIVNGVDRREIFRSIYLFKRNGYGWDVVSNNQIHEDYYTVKTKNRDGIHPNYLFNYEMMTRYNNINSGDEKYSTINVYDEFVFIILSMNGKPREQYPIFLFLIPNADKSGFNSIVKFEPNLDYIVKFDPKRNKLANFNCNNLEIEKNLNEFIVREIFKNKTNETIDRVLNFKIINNSITLSNYEYLKININLN